MALYFLDQSGAGLQFVPPNTPLVPFPTIISIDGDDIVTDGQTAFPVVVSNFTNTDRVTVSAGGETVTWLSP